MSELESKTSGYLLLGSDYIRVFSTKFGLIGQNKERQRRHQ